MRNVLFSGEQLSTSLIPYFSRLPLNVSVWNLSRKKIFEGDECLEERERASNNSRLGPTNETRISFILGWSIEKILKKVSRKTLGVGLDVRWNLRKFMSLHAQSRIRDSNAKVMKVHWIYMYILHMYIHIHCCMYPCATGLAGYMMHIEMRRHSNRHLNDTSINDTKEKVDFTEHLWET